MGNPDLDRVAGIQRVVGQDQAPTLAVERRLLLQAHGQPLADRARRHDDDLGRGEIAIGGPSRHVNIQIGAIPLG